MSTTVTTIKNAIEARIAAVLTGYSRLDYVYNLETNSFRSNDNRYGVRALSLTSDVDGSIIKSLTVDQDFEVILTSKYVNRANDTAQETAIESLFDDMDDLATDLFSSKVGIPSTVLVVNAVNVDEPEFLEENNIVALRGVFSIKYRKAI